LQSPQANGTLEVRATALKGLVVHVNDLADIVLREEATVEVASRGLNIGS
jgi:hypothetical protein